MEDGQHNRTLPRSSSPLTAATVDQANVSDKSAPPHDAVLSHVDEAVPPAQVISTITTASSAPHALPLHAPVLSFDNTKAGLQSVDKARTEAVLQQISQGSPFYENERRKAARRDETVRKLLEKNRVFEASVQSNPTLYRALQLKVDLLERDIEATQRRWGFVFVHMDMDMFYAAVEQKKNPHLKDVPFGVGSQAMLSTTNYIARQYGVRSGMAGFVGKKLCPELLIVPLDFDTYRAEGHAVRDVVRAYDPDFHSLGWDELTMELSGYLADHFPEAQTLEAKLDAVETVLRELRARVTEVTQLTASAGIAPNALLAKLASNYEKPNGQCCLRLTSREAVMAFMATLKVREVSGIGKSTEAILLGLGIHTMGDLYAERYRLHYLLTEKTYQFLLAASLGLGGYLDEGYFDAKDRRHAAPDPFDAGRLSIGTERTFGPLRSRAALEEVASHNLAEVHKDMCERALLTSQVVLKLKHRSFHVRQYTQSVTPPTDDLEVLRRAVDTLLLPLVDAYGEYRLLGVRCAKLITKAEWERQAQRQKQGMLSSFFSHAGTKRQRREYSLSSSSSHHSGTHSRAASLSDDSDEEVVVVVSDSRRAESAKKTTTEFTTAVSTTLDHVHSVEILSPTSNQVGKRVVGSGSSSSSSQASVIIIDED